jgi:glutathione synthase/RimK-type ligase-like ATP-grasp enzyme
MSWTDPALLIVLNGYELHNPDYLATKGYHDTGLQLVRAAIEQGERVLVACAAAEPGQQASVFATPHTDTPLRLHPVKDITLTPITSRLRTAAAISYPLTREHVKAMLIRQDLPANDQRYNDVLHHAAAFEAQSGIVSNSVRILRDMHEKRSVYNPDFRQRWPGMVAPVIESRDTEEILSFWRDSTSGTVLKPTDGFGGMGIALLKRYIPEQEARQRLEDYLHTYAPAEGDTIFAQECIPEVERNGDIRLLVAHHPDGTLTAGATRRVNNTGDIVANMAAGGKAMPLETLDTSALNAFEPDSKTVLNVLRQEFFSTSPDLSLVGVDMLYDPRDNHWKIGELNVTAPTCSYEIHDFTGIDVATATIKAVQARVAENQV